MKETLIIRLGQSVNQPIHWLVSAEGEQDAIASGSIENSLALETLVDKSISRELVVLLPASQVQLKTVALPAKFSRKLEAALPFMLEEELACELDDVLISLHEPCMLDDKHAIQVAICQRSWFTNWMDVLKNASLEPKRVIPDALLLPVYDDNQVTTVQFEDTWLFKMAPWQIAEVEANWILPFLSTLNEQDIVHLSDVNFDYPALSQRLDDYDIPLNIFAKSLKQQPFNMLQGDFKVQKKSSGLWQIWQIPAMAAGIVLLFSLILKAVTAYQLEQQVVAAKTETIKAYQAAFPGSKVRANLIRRQIKSKLSEVSGDADVGFLFLLDSLTPIFKEVDAFTPESFRYDAKRNELRLRATAKDFQSFNAVKQRLEQNSLTVEQGSLSNSGNLVVGELRIKAS